MRMYWRRRVVVDAGTSASVSCSLCVYTLYCTLTETVQVEALPKWPFFLMSQMLPWPCISNRLTIEADMPYAVDTVSCPTGGLRCDPGYAVTATSSTFGSFSLSVWLLSRYNRLSDSNCYTIASGKTATNRQTYNEQNREKQQQNSQQINKGHFVTAWASLVISRGGGWGRRLSAKEKNQQQKPSCMRGNRDGVRFQSLKTRPETISVVIQWYYNQHTRELISARNP